jgi:hypothetical protein
LDRFAACFEDVKDPRSGNAARHDFHTLLIIALCTILSGGQGAVDMALFARTKEPFLRGFLDLKNGPPSHDTFSRLFRHLDPDCGRPRGYRFGRKKGQRATAAPATPAALAWSGTLGFLRLVQLLTLRRRQAGIVRSFPGITEPRFKIGNPPLRRLKPLAQRPDQGVFLGVAQVVEIGKLGHAPG